MANDSAPWAQGYVSDTAYTDHYFREFSPVVLNYVATINGSEPRPLTPGFTYCELGCGRGQTINVLAAANPQGRFYACDFNPTHVASARRLADAAGLTNLTVVERNFEEMIGENLPDFDFIALHGVWSWISETNRRHIVDFIYRRLKPGGLVYISYNCLPGWSPVAPMRQILRATTEAAGGDSIAKAKGGLAFLKRLQETKAKYFAANPAAEKFLGHIENQSPAYIAHEYMNEDWHLFYSTDVARDLAAAKLKFAGSATIVENHRALVLTKPMAEFVNSLPSREVRELALDFLINQRFRRDVFVRGGTPLSPAAMQQRIQETSYGLVRTSADTTYKGRSPSGEFAFDTAIARAVVAALASGPRTIAALSKNPELANAAPGQVQQSVSLLVAAGQAAPCVGSAPPARAYVTGAKLAVPLAFNRTILAESLDTPDHATFASLASGAGVWADVIDRLFLGSLVANPACDPPAETWAKLQSRGVALRRDGKPLAGPEANIAELRRRYDAFCAGVLPFLIGYGVVEPA